MTDPVDEIATSFADGFADYMVANLLDGEADGGVVSMSPRNLVDTVSDLLADFLRDIAALTAEARDEQAQRRSNPNELTWSDIQRSARMARGEQPAPPTTCPTCGSDTPMVCHIGLVRPHHHGIIGDGSCCCPDSWHGEQR